MNYRQVKFKLKNYIYGPVYSRRFGFSLGIDIVPYKICSFDCVYCQLGPTTLKTIKRQKFIDLKRFEFEFKKVINSKLKIDVITLSGSGEPLLNSQTKDVIKIIKKYTSKPVGVLTNGSLFYKKSVIDSVKRADIIVPSLDAPDKDTFQKINSPHPSIDFKRVVQGLVELRREFKNKFYLEKVKGTNCTFAKIKKN